MNVLVTGGTGYLGSHLIKKLVERQHVVLCIKLLNDRLDNLKTVLPMVQFLDVEDLNFNDKIKRFSPEAVIHTACAYERGGNSYEQVLSANLFFPLKVLQICLEIGVKRWINTATALAHNLNAYALSKHQFSEWGKFFTTRTNLTFLNLQLEHFYGENGPETHFISWLIKKLQRNEPLELTDGTQKRDFAYVGDIETIFCELLVQQINGYWDIPVGTGVTSSIREVVEYLHVITNSNSELHFGAIEKRVNEPDSFCDTSILDSFNLKCTRHWKDGMKLLVEGEDI